MSKKNRDMIPETEQNNISQTKEAMLAWDPDFTKVTPEERKRIDKADQELKEGEYTSHEDVWKFIE